MKWILFLAACIWLGAVGCQKSEQTAQQTGAPPPTAYAQAAEVFAKHCVMCHSGAKPKAGLDLTSYQKIMAGTRIGPAVEPGNPDGSLIIRAIKGEGVKKMPPKGEPVSAEELAIISNWIKSGAKS